MLKKYLGLSYTLDNYEPASLFERELVPEISLHYYLVRIDYYLFQREEMADKLSLWTGTFILLERFTEMTNTTLNWHNIHTLIAISALVALKTTKDKPYDNYFSAHVFGFELQHCNELEKKFLFLIGYRCSISKQQYMNFIHHFSSGVLKAFPKLQPESLIFPTYEPKDTQGELALMTQDLKALLNVQNNSSQSDDNASDHNSLRVYRGIYTKHKIPYPTQASNAIDDEQHIERIKRLSFSC